MKILHIDCSPRAHSHSRRLSTALVARLLMCNPGAAVIRRDLGRQPLPHASAEYAETLSSPDALNADLAKVAVALSEELINEIERSDVLVIGTPMNNFTVPSVLKAWIDQILRMGRTMGVNDSGEKIGLLNDKLVYVAVASGGVYTGERANQPDFLTPYLVAALGCVGLTSIKFFPLQATAFLDDATIAAQREQLLDTLPRPLAADLQY